MTELTHAGHRDRASSRSGSQRPVDLQQDHRHVVVLIGARRRTPRPRGGCARAAPREASRRAPRRVRAAAPRRRDPRRSIASVTPSVKSTKTSPPSSGMVTSSSSSLERSLDARRCAGRAPCRRASAPAPRGRPRGAAGRSAACVRRARTSACAPRGRPPRRSW